MTQRSQEIEMEAGSPVTTLNDTAEQSQEDMGDSPPATNSPAALNDPDTPHLALDMAEHSQAVGLHAKQSHVQRETSRLQVTPQKRMCLRKRRIAEMMSSSSSESDDDDSEYIPTPLRLPAPRHFSPVKTVRPVYQCSIPHHCALLDLRQLDHLFEQINDNMKCRTIGCQGKFVPTTASLGGTATCVYLCTGCRTIMEFRTSSSHSSLAKADVNLAAQVAFLAAGCTYTTYVKVLNHVLGIKVVSAVTFSKTIETLHPIVKGMVDEMCEREKRRMKTMKGDELGAWKQAVTCADGTWMTRGFHSKNATFSIRNYFTGALLYYKHLCQKGTDNVIKEKLYEGTSKSAEGYAARELLQMAKDEGMNISVHWQDGDSSSSNAVSEIFPNAALMMCGGHAGKAHLKQLQSKVTMKKFTANFKAKYRDQFPEVDTVECPCTKHEARCGCMTNSFCRRARNNFSSILSSSDSAEEFSERLEAMVYHVQDIHSWDGGQCQFHSLVVCSCGKCPDKNEPECNGKEYHTRGLLSCPFHILVYKIECYARSQMANKLVHPTLKRGHTNQLESSHSVLLRFRPKHISLERLHYNVSTNLGLLQANMTNEFVQQGPAYHWMVELLQRLELPVYDGVRETFEKSNRQRKKALDFVKTTKHKKRRVELRTLRTKDAQKRILWSKQHGHDTYGEKEVDDEEEKKKGGKKDNTAKKVCKCGSTKHSKITHRDCPFKNTKHTTTHSSNTTQDSMQAYDSSDDDTCTLSSSCESSKGEANSETDENNSSGGELDMDIFEDVVITGCSTCGALNRAHEMTCPMNPHTKPREKESHIHLKAGDYAYLHSDALKGNHLCCRVVEHVPGKVASVYRLTCQTGVVRGMHSKTELTSGQATNPYQISLDNWRTQPKISLKEACRDPQNLQMCKCEKTNFVHEIIDIENAPITFPQSEDKVWIENSLYVLNESDRDTVTFQSGWLNDNIITAAQMLLLQHFPHVSGLQPPTLEREFRAHAGPFAQIVHTRNNHWILVSNLGCADGEIYVYDTMYTSLTSSTIETISRLSFSSSPTLTIKMVDVDRQKNSSDCGVLCVAITYDVLHGNGPCVAVYDHTRLREHLCECLKNCCLTPFPVLSRHQREDIKIKFTEKVELFCICRMPENPGQENMAECEGCEEWFHQHCCNIPEAVFDETIREKWQCQKCTQKL